MGHVTKVAQLVEKQEQDILRAWMKHQLSAITLRADLINEKELQQQSREFLKLFVQALNQDGENIDSAPWKPVKELAADVSRSRAMLGFSPSETAMFIFSLKQPIFDVLGSALDSQTFAAEAWPVTVLLDQLGLYTTEIHQQSRESIINRQQQELLELSTPVVQLWDKVVALPLIGMLDSARTQIVMENLLQKVVDTEASIAIIDITGVPTVDTLVAQHLLKTVAAARLMGADCIISGIRPQIAQTIVHLGIDLTDIITKSTLADAFAIALQRTGAKVMRVVASE